MRYRGNIHVVDEAGRLRRFRGLGILGSVADAFCHRIGARLDRAQNVTPRPLRHASDEREQRPQRRADASAAGV